MKRPALVLVAALALLAPLCGAQMRGGFHGSGRVGRGFGRSSYGRGHNAFASSYFLGNAAFFYDDYPLEPVAPETAGPQVIVVQAPAAEEAPQARATPLLIELQGDRYVRYGGVGQTGHDGAPERETLAQDPPATRALRPTVLVYQDGHREEVPDYAIVGRVMYAHGGGEGAGYGLKNIQLSSLDISATIRANRENGVAFVLPAGPNEVVTRP